LQEAENKFEKSLARHPKNDFKKFIRHENIFFIVLSTEDYRILKKTEDLFI